MYNNLDLGVFNTNTNVDAHLCLGGVYEALQKYDKAAAAFNNVL